MSHTAIVVIVAAALMDGTFTLDHGHAALTRSALSLCLSVSLPLSLTLLFPSHVLSPNAFVNLCPVSLGFSLTFSLFSLGQWICSFCWLTEERRKINVEVAFCCQIYAQQSERLKFVTETLMSVLSFCLYLVIHLYHNTSLVPYFELHLPNKITISMKVPSNRKKCVRIPKVGCAGWKHWKKPWTLFWIFSFENIFCLFARTRDVLFVEVSTAVIVLKIYGHEHVSNIIKILSG